MKFPDYPSNREADGGTKEPLPKGEKAFRRMRPSRETGSHNMLLGMRAVAGIDGRLHTKFEARRRAGGVFVRPNCGYERLTIKGGRFLRSFCGGFRKKERECTP